MSDVVSDTSDTSRIDTSRIDTAGMAVQTQPIDGGVLIVDQSLPPDDPHRMLWRQKSPDEIREGEARAASSATFERVDAVVFLRMTRDALMQATDHLKDDPRWESWRKELLDFPATADPENPVWPVPQYAISSLLQWRSLWPELDWEPLLS